jgi:hypothetical protein
MRTNRPRQRTQVLNLAVQDLNLRHRFPRFTVERSNGVWTWRGNLQPRPSSPVYQVSIRCRHGGVPIVRVLSPALAPNAPHLYRGGKLCLYWPEEWRWYGDELIAETILPWTASWLFYYELWLDTGKWLGPSSHAISSPKTESDRAA